MSCRRDQPTLIHSPSRAAARCNARRLRTASSRSVRIRSETSRPCKVLTLQPIFAAKTPTRGGGWIPSPDNKTGSLIKFNHPLSRCPFTACFSRILDGPLR
jgi:hypothetical protein